MSKMAIRQAKVRYTYNDYLLLPEDKRFEILDGELLLVPAPNIRHQRVSQRLTVALLRHIEAGDLGEMLVGPCDVILSDENVVQPDLLFVRKERLAIIGEANIKDAPDMVIEILSPGSQTKTSSSREKPTPVSGFRNTGSWTRRQKQPRFSYGPRPVIVRPEATGNGIAFTRRSCLT